MARKKETGDTFCGAARFLVLCGMRNQLNYEGGVSDSWLKAARILIGVISPLFVLIVALGGLFG